MGACSPDAVEMQVSVLPVDVTGSFPYLSMTQSHRLLEVGTSFGKIQSDSLVLQFLELKL